MASNCYIGCLVHIESDGDILSGIVASINKSIQRISLEKVVSEKTKKKKEGLTHFFMQDIDNITILSEAVQGNRIIEKDNLGRRVAKQKISTAHLKKLQPFSSNDFLLKSTISSGSDKDETKDSRTRYSAAKTKAVAAVCDESSVIAQQRTDSYTLLDAIDRHFRKAMAVILERDVVGFGAQGVLLGRNGKLCWIQVDVGSHIYLFDIVTLGAKAFEEGLAELIKHPNIQKVVHDCRFLSDLLFHQYQLNFVNVFDTQVACALVYKIFHGNDLPKYVDSLSTAIFQHLPEVASDDVFINRVRQASVEEDQRVWAERPACQAVVSGTVKDVKHLLRLREVLMSKLLTDLVRGIDIYLSVARDAGEQQADHCRRSLLHELPAEFRQIPSYAEERRVRPIRGQRDELFYDRQGFRINRPAVRDPFDGMSTKGISHKRNGVVERNCSPTLPHRRGRASRREDSEQSYRRARSLPRSRSDARDDVSDSSSVLELGAQKLQQLSSRGNHSSHHSNETSRHSNETNQHSNETSWPGKETSHHSNASNRHVIDAGRRDNRTIAANDRSQDISERMSAHLKDLGAPMSLMADPSMSDNEVAVINDTRALKSPLAFAPAGHEIRGNQRNKHDPDKRTAVVRPLDATVVPPTDLNSDFGAIPDSAHAVNTMRNRNTVLSDDTSPGMLQETQLQARDRLKQLLSKDLSQLKTTESRDCASKRSEQSLEHALSADFDGSILLTSSQGYSYNTANPPQQTKGGFKASPVGVDCELALKKAKGRGSQLFRGREDLFQSPPGVSRVLNGS